MAAMAGLSLTAPAYGQKQEDLSSNDQETMMKNINDTIQGPEVEIKTTMGDIVVKLYNDTPLHRDNFLKLVKEGFYEGVLFHRVINDFMVQAGDPASKGAPAGKMLGAGDPGYTIQAEIDYPRHYHKYGALAAARTGDAVNPERRSSGSQFFIVTGRKVAPQQLEMMMQQSVIPQRQALFTKLAEENSDTIRKMLDADDQVGLDKLQQELIKRVEEEIPAVSPSAEMTENYTTIGGTPHLDGQYTVFGEVLSGMDVVEKIQKVETDSNDRPLEDVKIISVKLIKE